MKKRAIGLVTVGVTAALVLSGCGAANNAPAATGGTTTINVAYWPGPELTAMQAVVKKYNAGQGKTDHVSVNLTTFSTADMFNKELVDMSTKSSTLDMYYTASYLLGQHAPYLVPLTGVDTKALLASAVKGFSADGKFYAVPMDASFVGTIYRTDLMKTLLGDPAARQTFETISQKVVGKKLDPKPPAEWTWDDYLATGAYFTKKYNPNSPTEYGTILPAMNSAFSGMQWAGVLYSMGGSFTTKDGKQNFGTPQAKQAVELYATAIKDGIASPNSSQGNATSLNAALTSGSVAFEMQWHSSLAGFNDASAAPVTAGKVAIVAIPGGHKGHMHLQGLGINKYSKHIDAAKKFVNYLLTPAALDTYGNNGGIPPAPSYLNSTPALKPIGVLMRDDTESEPSIGKVDAYTVSTLIGNTLSNAWLGNEDPAAALTALQAALKKQAAG
ncbi:MAG: extracellular solute-binding protein [Microbacteriaceae bacterium]|nr:MAG: extracellular solute-binding protein [Microbacteriaceae bacterium]